MAAPMMANTTLMSEPLLLEPAGLLLELPELPLLLLLLLSTVVTGTVVLGEVKLFEVPPVEGDVAVLVDGAGASVLGGVVGVESVGLEVVVDELSSPAEGVDAPLHTDEQSTPKGHEPFTRT